MDSRGALYARGLREGSVGAGRPGPVSLGRGGPTRPAHASARCPLRGLLPQNLADQTACAPLLRLRRTSAASRVLSDTSSSAWLAWWERGGEGQGERGEGVGGERMRE
jgi:hypothetical protein